MDKPITSYREAGSGIPVILLHGFAEDGSIWDNQLAHLEAHCRLIIPDLPAIPSLETIAVTIKDLLDQLGITQCIMIGHSMGGYITLAFAALYPERLNAIGLFHSTAYPDSEEKKANRRKSIEFIRKHGAETFVRQSTPGLFGEYTHQHNPALIDSTVDRYAQLPGETLIAWYEAMIARPDRTDVLRTFNGAVLFIIGEEDTIVPMQSSLEQARLPALSHIHIIEKAGHEGMLEEPARANDILHSFINFVKNA